ncbi:MAG: hypothetical protein ACPGXX_15555, partial [Planctomycetaceae bacterium]
EEFPHPGMWVSADIERGSANASTSLLSIQCRRPRTVVLWQINARGESMQPTVIFICSSEKKRRRRAGLWCGVKTFIKGDDD